MSNPIEITGHADHLAEAVVPSTLVNTTTKEDLLSRAKDAIEAGEQSMQEAAEALAVAKELYGATQAEMARAIGKSEPWVSYLLSWRRSGYKGESPFGPTTKAGRLQHAEDRAARGEAKSLKSKKIASMDAVPEVSGEKTTSASVTAGSTLTDSDARRLAEFKYAVDHWLAGMSDQAKREAVAYVIEKAGVQPS